MKVTLRLLFIAILLVGQSLPLPYSTAPQASANTRSNKLRALNSAVQVITETTFGTSRRSTGYLFTSSGFVITTFHAVSDAKKITVYHADHGVFEVGGVRKVDQRADIAVLWLANCDQLKVSCATFGDSRRINAGAKVNVVHHPAYQDEALARASVISSGYPPQFEPTELTRKLASEHVYLEISGVYDSGSAGGLVCNESYEVVGMIIGGNGNTPGDGSQGAYAVSSHYLNQLLSANSKLGLSGLAAGQNSDATFFDKFLGPAPQRRPFKDMMTEGFLLWFSPSHHFTIADPAFSQEINDKVDKSWFHTANLVVDKRPLREWSASRVFVWDAANNPWDLGDAADRFVHFDADSKFSKLIYKERETEERIMTRYLIVMQLDPGMHKVQYANRGANYKATGTRRRSFEVSSASIELIDIEGLSLVSMLQLPTPVTKVGEAEPIKYELERHMIQQKEINSAIRSCRYFTK